MRVSEIRVNQIRVNQGLGVLSLDAYMVSCQTCLTKSRRVSSIEAVQDHSSLCFFTMFSSKRSSVQVQSL